MVHPSYTPCLRHALQFLSLQLRPHTLHCLLRAHSQPSPDLLLLRTYSRVTHSLKASQLYSRLTTASPALSGCSELIHASLRADLQLRLSPSRLTHSLLTAFSICSELNSSWFACSSLTVYLQPTHGHSPLCLLHLFTAHSHPLPVLLRGYSLLTDGLPRLCSPPLLQADPELTQPVGH